MVEKEILKKMLVPTDGSQSSLMAEEMAAAIAKKTRASITVFYVLPELWSAYPLPEAVQVDLLGSIHQRSEKILNSARTLFNEEKVSVGTETRRETQLKTLYDSRREVTI